MSHSPTNNRVQQMQNVQTEGLELFKKKNADYGDSFANFGPVGVIVRMGYKINRLSSVTKNGVNLVDNESVRDTLIDLHNYAAMAIMLLDEKKKKKTRVEQIKEMEASYNEGNYGYGHAKQALHELICNKYSIEIEIFNELMNNKNLIENELKKVAVKARKIAKDVLNRVRTNVGY